MLSSLLNYRQLVTQLINKAIEPHPNIYDPEDRYRSSLLNSLVLIYLPIAIFIILFRITVLPDDVGSTIVITSIGILVVILIYTVGRLGHYLLSVYLTVGLGYGVIYFNAVNSSAPHFEIAYLIFIPLLGIVLFSMREAMLNFLIAMGLMFIFLITCRDMEKTIAVDLFVFMLLAQGFIFFANYQRNRLDKHRRELVVEKERSQISKELVDNISHDLKTPLSVIKTSSYIGRRSRTPEKLEQHFLLVETQVSRLESMIQDLLIISKLGQYTQSQRVEVNVCELLDTTVEGLTSIAKAKNIVIRKNIATDVPHIVGVVEDLERMTLNLVENAINYTPDGGIVTISLSSLMAKDVCLEVADTGIGIGKDDLERVFERFYRADKARSTHNGGTGLGLSIVKEIVRDHQGEIRIDSELGVGTVFSIRLPISQHNPN